MTTFTTYAPTGIIEDRTGVVNIKQAAISLSASTIQLIAAVTGKKIRILSAILSASNSATKAKISFLSGASTPLTDTLIVSFGAPLILLPSVIGWCETLKGESLSVVGVGGNAVVNVSVSYVEITP